MQYSEPDYVDYYYDEEDLPGVIEELSNIENTIGLENLQKLHDFWDSVSSYNDKILEEHGMLELWNKHKSDYTDYLLGIKIRDCIKEHGSCSFTAEL